MILSALAAILIARDSIWSKSLPDGAVITLIAVTDNLQEKSWSPEGKPFDHWVTCYIDKSLYSHPSANPKNDLSLVFRLQHTAGSEFPNITGSAEGAEFTERSVCPQDEWQKEGVAGAPYLLLASRGFDPGEATTDARIGCADGPWENLSTYNVQTHLTKGVPFAPEMNVVTNKKSNYKYLEVKWQPPSSFDRKNTQYRLVAISENGHAMEGGSETEPTANPPLDFGYGIRRNRAVSVKLQRRPYTWLTFAGIQLRAK